MSIEIKNVVKKFGKNTAINGISLRIEEGKIYGLLGRNGAGKSTLLNIISNRIYMNDGEILIDGEQATENPKAQSKIYLMSERNMYPSSMEIGEMIKWTKRFYPDADTEKAKEISKRFNLDLKKTFGSLSTGYRSIAKFVMAISSNAKYTLLDEPVLGLDANHRDLLYKIILKEYSESQRTIVIATHLIEEITSLLEEVVIINNGKVVELDSVEHLLSRGYTATGRKERIDRFIQDKNCIGYDEFGAVKVAYILGIEGIKEIPDDIEITGLNLQKLFVQLTGETEDKAI